MVYLAVASIAIAVIAAGVGTWQAVEARQQAADEADAVAEQKKQEAAAARDSAAFEAQQHRRRVSLLLGKQSAVTAAAGVDLLSGSAISAEIDLTEQGALEALNIERGGKIESNARIFESRLAKFRADTSRGQVPYDIAGGVLSASSGVTSAYAGYKYGSPYGAQMRRRGSVAGSMYGDDYSGAAP